jgi:hypothetical protein
MTTLIEMQKVGLLWEIIIYVTWKGQLLANGFKKNARDESPDGGL